jgi:activator of HSP90 ATPase
MKYNDLKIGMMFNIKDEDTLEDRGNFKICEISKAFEFTLFDFDDEECTTIASCNLTDSLPSCLTYIGEIN